jgi:hypothetical protein
MMMKNTLEQRRLLLGGLSAAALVAAGLGVVVAVFSTTVGRFLAWTVGLQVASVVAAVGLLEKNKGELVGPAVVENVSPIERRIRIGLRRPGAEDTENVTGAGKDPFECLGPEPNQDRQAGRTGQEGAEPDQTEEGNPGCHVPPSGSSLSSTRRVSAAARMSDAPPIARA